MELSEKIIAITGGKGGTGKSTVATTLAKILSKKKKVLLVDMDVGCPNDHLLLSMKLKRKKSVKQRIPRFDEKKCTKCGLCSEVCVSNAIVNIDGIMPIFVEHQCNGCGACFYKCPFGAISWSHKIVGHVNFAQDGNLSLLSGELKLKEPSPERIIDTMNEMIKAIEIDYDIIIIDTAAGSSCEVISALALTEKALAVTEPTPLGEHDLNIIMSLLKTLGKHSGIIINRSDVGDKKLIERLSNKFGSKILLELPYSRSVAEAYSGANQYVHELFDKIEKNLSGENSLLNF